MNDLELMQRAFTEAEKCQPSRPRIPKVGAIIAVNGAIVGSGHRGTGNPGDDDHAEMHAIKSVHDKTQLAEQTATIYTTLEPCTPEVRSDPLTCCTELIRQNRIKKVFIGILDPNQGVRGKGLWELQERGIKVELFPPDLQEKIRIQNDVFFRTQRTLGIRINSPGNVIKTYETDGEFTFSGDALLEPKDDVIVMTNVGAEWWPQPHNLSVDPASNAPKFKWGVKVHFGLYGPHSLYIVRANDAGLALVNYYRKVTKQNFERVRLFKDKLTLQGAERKDFLKTLPGSYPSIIMNRLPKGLEFQAKIDFEVERPPSK